MASTGGLYFEGLPPQTLYLLMNTEDVVPAEEIPDEVATKEQSSLTSNGQAQDEQPTVVVSSPNCPVRTHFRTTNPMDEIDIAMGTEGLKAAEPITIGQLFKDTVSKIPDHPALRYREGEDWKTISYSEYYQHSVRAAKSFLKVS